MDNLTQSDIVDILTNNGEWKGIYYLNGRLYISFDAALGGELTLGGANNGNGKLVIRDSSGNQVGYIDNTGVNFTKGTFSGDLDAASGTFSGKLESASGTFTGTLSANDGNIGGWIIDKNSKKISSPDGTIVLDAKNNKISINGVGLYAYGNGLVANGGLNIICGTNDFSDGTDRFQILNLTNSSTGNYLRIQHNQVFSSSSSSERYKILGKALSEEFVKNLYNINPIMARYKDGYLDIKDERAGIEFPMFIAEDVNKYFPLAVDHVDGLPENWNERIMVPAMFAMIKQQHEEINELKQIVKELQGGR